MVVPTKPKVTKQNDTSVLVEWTIPDNDGLAIKFFVVQYKEVFPNKDHWQTEDKQILSKYRKVTVNLLKPGLFLLSFCYLLLLFSPPVSHDQSRSVVISHSQSWPVMVSHDQSRPVMISRGQSWSVTISCDQSWSVTASHGQSWSVTVSRDQSRSVMVSHDQSRSVTVSHGHHVFYLTLCTQNYIVLCVLFENAFVMIPMCVCNLWSQVWLPTSPLRLKQEHWTCRVREMKSGFTYFPLSSSPV